MKITIPLFKGETPKTTSNLLQDYEAVSAINCDLDEGDLRGWMGASEEEVIAAASAISLFYYDDAFIADTIDIDYARSAVASDTYERVYFTGNSEPRAYSNVVTGYYKLGLPAPGDFAVASSGGGSSIRAYAQTYVTLHGEEGPPSNVASITNYDSGNVTFSSIDDAPANYAIAKTYFYRSNDSITGVTSFQFALEATWFLTTVAYAVGDFVIYSNALYECTTIHPAGAWDAGHFTSGEGVTTLGEVCPSETWLAPPAGMKGIIGLPNGIYAGFNGNEVFPSIPYMPHAWPDLSLSQPYTVIALGHFDSTIVAATNGYPYLIYGDHPDDMQIMSLSDFQPCISKRSLANSRYGVIYASNEGLILINQNGVSNITFQSITMREWQELTPSGIHGHVYNNKYFGFNPSANKSFVFNLETKDFVRLSGVVYEGFVDTDGFYVIVEEKEDLSDPTSSDVLKVKKWGGDPYSVKRYTWESKEFDLGYNVNFVVARLIPDTDFYQSILSVMETDDYLADLNEDMITNMTLGGAINQNVFCALPISGSYLNKLSDISVSDEILFSLYGDGELVYTKSITDSKPFKLPGGMKYRKCKVRVSGYVPISPPLVVATSMEELCQ